MSAMPSDSIVKPLTDMHALERHVLRALEVQLGASAPAAGGATSELRKVRDTCERHVAALDALARRRNLGRGLPATSVKQAASSMIGVSAIAVEFVRSEQLPQTLPDLYAAVTLMSVGYVLLHRTALSCADSDVIALATRCLSDHSRSTLLLRTVDPARLRRAGQAVRYPLESAPRHRASDAHARDAEIPARGSSQTAT